MKLLKRIFIGFIIFAIILGIVITRGNIVKSKDLGSKSVDLEEIDLNSDLSENIPKLASGEVYELLKDILDLKLYEFASNKYFSENYVPSIQAIYYALYILNAIDSLNLINQTAIFYDIMSYYNETTGIFKDGYAERYLYTDFRANYYPLTSLLQVNCYAVLSLNILGKLSLETIDISKMVQFIWDCYNPETSGFIGQIFSTDLNDEFKYSTMDNTYYAILSLETLGDNFNLHVEELDELIDFIQELQYLNPSVTNYGGFDNSQAYFHTIFPYDPTLWSAYFCIKSLDILGLINTIDIAAFYQYLEGLYDDQIPCFKMGHNLANEYDFDIIGAAFGLQLSDLTGYVSYNRMGVINFILNNRNALGLWNSTTTYNLYELIDTFQVIRALYETGELSQLSSNEKTQIFNNIEDQFTQFKGYSLIANQYYSLEYMHAIIRSFYTNGMIEELNDFYPKFYERIMYLYNYRSGVNNWYYFKGWVNNDYTGSIYPELRVLDVNFRSRPLEFFSDYYHAENNEIGLCYSHKTTFEALDTLKAIYKLNFFHMQYDLSRLAQDIVDSQFLESSYPNYGGFVPNMWIKSKLSLDAQNDYVYLEYTYYAIKALELIAESIGEEDIVNFGFDKDALGSYINRYFHNGHFNPSYTEDVHNIIRNTYYMAYIIKLLEPASLSSQEIAEIKNFVENNIDYKNIKNIYYSYKIYELFNFSVDLDFFLTQKLIKNIYSNDYNSFFIDLNKDYMDQEIILWIYDMANNNKMIMKANHPDKIQLGTSFDINVSLYNIVLDYFGDNIEVEYISYDEEISIPFIREDNIYQAEIFLPSNNAYYPSISGEIIVTEGFIEIARFPIIFQTLSDLYENEDSPGIQEDDENSEIPELVEPSVEMALPIMITLIGLPSFVMFLTSRKKRSDFINQ